MQTIKGQIKNYNILIITHYCFYPRTFSGSPSYELINFLLKKVKSIVYIEHPFPYINNNKSYVIIYENGKLIKELFLKRRLKPDFFSYVQDFILNNYFFIKTRKKIDLCFAFDNLNAVSLLFWRKIKFIKKLIYYTIDYTPYRFANKFLNLIYHFFDRRACYNADYNWVFSKRMVEGREKNGVNPKKCAENIITPMGANLSRIMPLPYENINRFSLVYLGKIGKKQGLQLILEVLSEIKYLIPKLKFIIIGRGDYESELKNLSKKLGLNKIIDFRGFVSDHQEIEKIFCRSAVGLAPYLKDEKSYTYYADQGKPKIYLGCGLPVIITKFPIIAEEIAKYKAGMVINYNKNELKSALLKLLKDDIFYKNTRENAIKLSRSYDFKIIFENALKQSFS